MPLPAHPWPPAADALLHCEGIQRRPPNSRAEKKKELSVRANSCSEGPKTLESIVKKVLRLLALLLPHLCDQIRVADNGSHKETIVGDLCAHFHTGCTQVQVHLMVGTWDGSQGKIAHAVELQLES